jgi:hypothetical protein
MKRYKWTGRAQYIIQDWIINITKKCTKELEEHDYFNENIVMSRIKEKK